MKHLLTTAAVMAVLAFSAPVWAQPANPSGGSAMPESTSATPPKHHPHHGKMAAHHRGKGPRLTGGSAEQLNQEELARLQTGNTSMPAAPAMSSPTAAPAGVGRGFGPKTSGSNYIPPSAGMPPPAAEPMGEGPGPKPSGSGYIPSTPGGHP